jgi:hypothetical protein
MCHCRKQKRWSLTDLQAAQWVIMVSALLAAGVLIGLLVVTFDAFKVRQNAVDERGYSNFLSDDPSRL